MKTTIYLTRHGETDYNARHIVQGRKINSDLNTKGQEQSRIFYETYHTIPFERLYISSLKRTYQSMIHFIDKGMDYVVMDNLDELSFGLLEGQPFKGSDVSPVFSSLISKWDNGEPHLKAPDGESPYDVACRLQKAFDEILENKEETILVCIHGRAIRILLSQLLHGDLNNMGNYTHDNLKMTILEYDHTSKKYTLKEFNS